MNFSEFKEKLGAEPRKAAAEHAADIARDPQWSDAADDALKFEARLEKTLRSPKAGDAVLEQILATPNRRGTRLPPTWLAIAASLLLVVGVSSVMMWQGRGHADISMQDYISSHYGHDGEAVLRMAAENHPQQDIATVFASLGVEASPQFARDIMFIKFCPTPDGKGAHMIVKTGQGPATVIFMPSVQVAEPMFLTFDNTSASVIGLQSGSAAIIGTDKTTAQQLEAGLKAGLRPLSVDA